MELVIRWSLTARGVDLITKAYLKLVVAKLLLSDGFHIEIMTY